MHACTEWAGPRYSTNPRFCTSFTPRPSWRDLYTLPSANDSVLWIYDTTCYHHCYQLEQQSKSAARRLIKIVAKKLDISWAVQQITYQSPNCCNVKSSKVKYIRTSRRSKIRRTERSVLEVLLLSRCLLLTYIIDLVAFCTGNYEYERHHLWLVVSVQNRGHSTYLGQNRCRSTEKNAIRRTCVL